jgi:hypothetical protein
VTSPKFPARWQREAVEALAPLIDSETRLSILVDDPATAIHGTLQEGYVYADGDGTLKVIYDHSGRPDVHPWDLFSGPVLRLHRLEPGKRRQLLYAHPDWTEPNHRKK